MANRSTFTTSELSFKLSESFLAKWGGLIHTNEGSLPISSKREGCKFGVWGDLAADLQSEIISDGARMSIDLVFIDNNGAIEHIEITESKIITN